MNPDYKHIERISLANNSLTSLRGIENSWLQRNGPVFLDIRNNQIKEVGVSHQVHVYGINIIPAGHVIHGADAEQGGGRQGGCLLLCWQSLVM